MKIFLIALLVSILFTAVMGIFEVDEFTSGYLSCAAFYITRMALRDKSLIMP